VATKPASSIDEIFEYVPSVFVEFRLGAHDSGVASKHAFWCITQLSFRKAVNMSLPAETAVFDFFCADESLWQHPVYCHLFSGLK
jgi:hypothetical protein